MNRRNLRHLFAVRGCSCPDTATVVNHELAGTQRPLCDLHDPPPPREATPHEQAVEVLERMAAEDHAERDAFDPMLDAIVRKVGRRSDSLPLNAPVEEFARRMGLPGTSGSFDDGPDAAA